MISIMMMMTMMTTRMMFINDLIDQSIEIRFLTAAAARMRIRKAKPTSGHLEPTSGHLDGERMSERHPSIMKIKNIKFKTPKQPPGTSNSIDTKQKQLPKKNSTRAHCELDQHQQHDNDSNSKIKTKSMIKKNSFSIKFLTGAGFYRQL